MSNENKYFIKIKQIGKGSFSNVFLCKHNRLSTILIDESNLYNNDDYFIIKEININTLVKKYTSKSNGHLNEYPKTQPNNVLQYIQYKLNNKNNNSPFKIDITPYGNKYKTYNYFKIDEYEYYITRLRDLIESEVDILMLLDHVHVIKCYNYFIEHEMHYLHMEYCELGDLYGLLKKTNTQNNTFSYNIYGGLSTKYIYDFLKQVTKGLLYIHQKNIIHRDIKLHNILLKIEDNDIVYKISDFGFSCYDMSNDSINLDEYDQKISNKYFKLCGTPYYMAPEIILNTHHLENFTKFENEKINKNKIFYNKKIDIWSYGICLYELVFNELPFPNIRNLKDLESFYKEEPQIYINNKLNQRKIDHNIKVVLEMTLKVDPILRCSIEELMTFVNNSMKYDILNDENTLCIENELDSIIKNNDNVYNVKYNTKLKTHIVENPIHNTLENRTLENSINNVVENNFNTRQSTVDLDSSWEEINKSSSLILKMSLKKGFLDWLTKNKI